jgi:hypothetical protein
MSRSKRPSVPPPATTYTRRRFCGVMAAGAAGLFAAPAVLSARNVNDKLNIAVIGAGGRGRSNTNGVASENIVALSDAHEPSLAAAAEPFPKARREIDFRKLFDRPQDFDAVVISTGERTHALATMMALKEKKHVYCEKPMTHSVWEARQVRLAAAEAKVATQMGIQIHAGENYPRVVEVLRSGAIGPIREVHIWNSRAWGWQSPEAAERNKDIVKVTERPESEGAGAERFELGSVARPRPLSAVSLGLFPGSEVVSLVGFRRRYDERSRQPLHRSGVLGAEAGLPADHSGQRSAAASVEPC